MTKQLERELEQIRARYLSRKKFRNFAHSEEKCDTINVPGNNNSDGGPGSGNHGHAGIPGTRGGSAPGGTQTTRASFSRSGNDKVKALNKAYNSVANQPHGTTMKLSVNGKSVYSDEHSRGILKYDKDNDAWVDIDTGEAHPTYDIQSFLVDRAVDTTTASFALSYNENRETPKSKASKKAAQSSETESSSDASGAVVQGKDISAGFSVNQQSKLNGVEQAAEIQGYNKAPKVVSNKEEFKKAAKESGVVGFRTVDGEWGGEKTSRDVCDEYMYKDGIKYNYGGGMAYGGGIYVATSKSLSASDIENASRDSWIYGQEQMAFTFTKDFKTVDKLTLKERWDNLAPSTQEKYMTKGRGIATGMTAYAAALGYDGVVNSVGWCDYTVVFNRSKMIAYSETNTGYKTVNVI